MPESPQRTARAVTSLAEAESVLREDGGRVSTARRAILTVLLRSDGPLSAEEIAATAAPPLDVPATYRNLEHLERLGLVGHVHLGHGPGLYELASDDDHEYALCEGCGTAVAVNPKDLDGARRSIELAIDIRPSFRHFPLVGLCADCRASS